MCRKTLTSGTYLGFFAFPEIKTFFAKKYATFAKLDEHLQKSIKTEPEFVKFNKSLNKPFQSWRLPR